ncbi:MAG: hypothetical protein ACYTGX_05610 [Planctomycetota bacterium]
MTDGLCLGLDEAGYGPTLGPLTLGLAVLSGPAVIADPATEGAAVWELLSAGTRPPGRGDADRVVVGDSKRIHKPGKGIGPLEEQALALLYAQRGELPADWDTLCGWLAPGERPPEPPWARGAELALPRAADPEAIRRRGGALASACAAAGVRLRYFRVRAVHEPEFNAGIAGAGNKSAALFGWAATLLDAVWRVPLADDAAPRLATCDKQGGRDRYLPLLGGAFPDAVTVRRGAEQRAHSEYTLRRNGRDAVIRFEAKGERHWPVAAASMLAKYVRELAMESLNTFWTGDLPELRATAGYPQDAKRFLADIEAARAARGIAREEMVRCR